MNISGSAAISIIRPLNVGSVDAVKAVERSVSKYSTKSIDDDSVELKSLGKSLLRDRGLSASSIRAQENISSVQAMDSTLEKSQDILRRMHDLATRSADMTYQNDRTALDLEYTQYKIELSELGTISFDGMEFEKVNDSITLSLPASADTGITTDVTIKTINADNLGDIRTSVAAEDALDRVDNAIGEVSASRNELNDVKDRILNSMFYSEPSSGNGSTGGSG